MAITTFKAKVVSTDDPNKYISYSRDFTVKFQTNELNNGYDEGITPNEGILCALGACEDIVAASFYKKKNLNIVHCTFLLEERFLGSVQDLIILVLIFTSGHQRKRQR
ncbi:hypothetical protein [Leuconostoc citreum]|uniref:hypothetical protein n=1 Tax=Leuconostoc citreum TaxID=33964 RepID=UPI00209421E5|nr:hypothetical protein [Leuconostoc citreum]